MPDAPSIHPRLVAPKPVRGMDYEQFKVYLKGEQKGDLIDGVAKIMAPASFSHERIFGFLFTLVRLYVSAKDLGVVLGSRTLVRIDERNGFEPDLLFVSKERQHIIKEIELTEAPDVAVEIVSRSSMIDDRARKFAGYERAGVKEYWLIDPEKKEAEFFERSGEEFALVELAEGVFHSKAVPGFYLRPEWLFAGPMPDELRLLR
jgi:Uma2 family endonuclease